MPWYDYQCEKCGTVFEVNRPMTESGKAKCTACGSTRTVRIYAAAPIVFKGGGFYATDSGSRSTTTAAPAEPAAVPEPATPAAPPTPKPEAKQPASKERKSA